MKPIVLGEDILPWWDKRNFIKIDLCLLSIDDFFVVYLYIINYII